MHPLNLQWNIIHQNNKINKLEEENTGKNNNSLCEEENGPLPKQNLFNWVTKNEDNRTESNYKLEHMQQVNDLATISTFYSIIWWL